MRNTNEIMREFNPQLLVEFMVELIGIAVCDECESRIRVLEKHRPIIGKAVRCPRCHTNFTLEVEQATQTELIAIETEEDAEQKRKPKKRRTKSEIRDEHIEQCREGFRALHARLKSISEDPKSSEEQVRVWVMDALRTALGYGDEQLDTECRALGNRVDIAIKDGDRIKVVIECKNMRSRLRNNVRDQVGVYAATLSAEWAVVTNGDIWKLYRVTPRKGQTPKMELVFDVALLDEDGVSDADAEHLYLLTERAMFIGDTDREFHEVICTSQPRLYEALFSDRVLNAVRVELTDTYKAEADQRVKLEVDDVRTAIHDLLTPLDF